MIKVLFFLLAAFCGAFQLCYSSARAPVPVQKVTYTADVQPLINLYCSPCHIPTKGKKKPLHNFESARLRIDETIRRIQLQPGKKGFMPYRLPRLSDSVINVFVKWKEDGLREK